MSIWNASSWSEEVYEDRLSYDEIEALGSALQEWAAEHPLADQPLLYIDEATMTEGSDESGRGISPRDIAQAVSDKSSPLREPMIRLFAVGMSGYAGGRQHAVDEVIHALHEDMAEWREERG